MKPLLPQVFSKIALPRKWRRVAIFCIMVTTIVAVSFDVFYAHRYASHYGNSLSMTDFGHAFSLLLLGSLISIVSYKTPRFIIFVIPTMMCLLTFNTISGFDLTTAHYLNRTEPHFPLEEFPWSLARFIPLVLLCWTFGVTFLVWLLPRLWSRYQLSLGRGRCEKKSA